MVLLNKNVIEHCDLNRRCPIPSAHMFRVFFSRQGRAPDRVRLINGQSASAQIIMLPSTPRPLRVTPRQACPLQLVHTRGHFSAQSVAYRSVSLLGDPHDRVVPVLSRAKSESVSVCLWDCIDRSINFIDVDVQSIAASAGRIVTPYIVTPNSRGS